jgi:hypothetical protein
VVKHFPDSFFVSFHDVSAKLDDWLHDELDEASLNGSTIITNIFNLPLFALGIKVVITP